MAQIRAPPYTPRYRIAVMYEGFQGWVLLGLHGAERRQPLGRLYEKFWRNFVGEIPGLKFRPNLSAD